MPQGRRKTPFSGKAKKDQLKIKKQSKTEQDISSKIIVKSKLSTENGPSNSRETVKVNYQPSATVTRGNRYALQFYKETDEEIKAHKERARHTLTVIRGAQLELNVHDFFPAELNFPKRPQWSHKESLDVLNAKENKYFTEYLNDIEKVFKYKDLSYFELNLETWRQLWRVIEMSDIILLIVDIRFPALMFPPSLYEYVTKDLGKDMILVLNKIDLADTALVVAWKDYFTKQYPELHVVMFTTVPTYTLMGKQTDKAGLNIRRRKGRARMAAEAAKSLHDVCLKIASVKHPQVDVSSWTAKIQEELHENDTTNTELIVTKPDLKDCQDGKNDTILTIGCVGQPNVGKSSLLNAVMGQRVVSVSRTPGHTRHFQTIFITETVRFCDCPGLVFPSRGTKALQVLVGSYPVAQLREPFSTVQFLAERLDLPRLLRIAHPEAGETEWSAMDVCDGWAKARGFLTAKAGRLDAHRAANQLLRMALDGKICLNFLPPGYWTNKDKWLDHPEIETVRWIQGITEDSPEMGIIPEADSDISCGSETSDKDGNNSDGSSDSEDVIPEYKNPFAGLENEND